MRLFGHPQVCTRIEYSKAKYGLVGDDFLETVQYGTKRSNIGFSAYNKYSEMRAKNVPFHYENKNILRPECRFRNRTAIKSKFSRDLTAYDLYCPELQDERIL